MTKRLDKIIEIAEKIEFPIYKVIDIYSRFKSRIYFQSVRKGENPQLDNSLLEEKTLKLTERYFLINKKKRKYG